MTANEVWELYSKLKKHFRTTSFDFYTSKTKIKPLKPESSDERVCSTLSSLPKVELFGRILANLIETPGIIPIQLLDAKAKEVWEFWDFRIRNKYWLFSRQLKTHYAKYTSLELENIVQAYCSSMISPETLVGLYRCQYPFSLDHEDPIVSTVSKLVLKYNSFLTFDEPQLKTIIKNVKLGE